MHPISLKEARLLAIHSQGLTTAHPFKGKKGALQAIEQIGYAQIDTLAVVKRAHHHVLWSRVDGYQPHHLHQLVEEKSVFEYWAHAAAYLPMRDYRFTIPRQEEVRASDGMWHHRNPGLIKYALDRIRAEGPLMSRDFDKGKLKLYFGNNKEGWSASAISHTLFQLFMEGELMVAGRKGFQKIYDLTERALPADVDTRRPNREEYIHFLIERDIRAHGLLKAGEIGYLIKNSAADINRRLVQMVEAGELIQLKVEGQEAPYYAFPSALEKLENLSRERRIRILSPFDNLVIQRRRLEELFGFSYTLECYVPKDKRKVGYFSLPLLRGNEFTGQIDLKAERKSQVLHVKNLVWEKGKAKQEHLWKALARSLQEFAAFNDCKSLDPAATLPDLGRNMLKWNQD
ncbi:MAG: YcaQ family DNA glycosylase [Lewinellaceae bacterium]|nr:YcaQ family DNA glycosylase [Lewinellaceae bacterium]